MWKGLSTSEGDIADVRQETFRPLLGDEVDVIWPEASERSEQP